ncbi:MAG: TIGR00282 family metallophosphoesterase [Puniceicoccales bacterium]|nr:TIGR00282 family metallophosphoesterase [Puniceicoccales bacterium]
MEVCKVLFLGDIVGQPGRKIVARYLPELKTLYSPTLVVANGENAAGGFGITRSVAQEIFSSGVDVITLGNHLWDQKSFAAEIDTLPHLCRPANLPSECPGKSYVVWETEKQKLGIFCLLGRQFMELPTTCPFKTADRIVDELRSQGIQIIFVDIHAETTSEKCALGWHLSGRVTAVFGTHTHVPTGDGRILQKATAYLTDAGMCGSSEGILGYERGPLIQKFIDGMPCRFSVAPNGPAELHGVVVVFDPSTGKATKIESVHRSEPA